MSSEKKTREAMEHHSRELGESIKKDDLNQFRALTESCPVSDEELINLTKEALQENASSITQYLLTQKGALILAAALGHKAIVALLLKKKADVNFQDKFGRTALIWAIIRGKTAIAKLLLKKKADTTCSDKTGKTALIWAAIRGKAAIAKLLLKKKTDATCSDKTGKTALIWAAEEGKIDTVDLLLKNQADVNCSDETGKTALIRAAEEGHVGTVALLIKHEANVHCSDKADKMALIYASEEGHAAIVALLIKHGANVDQPNNAHDTALVLVIEARREAIEELLTQAGGLTYEGQGTHRATAKLLIQAGALTYAGQEDYLADWQAMRDYRAALYDTLRPRLQHRLRPTDVSEDVLRFTLQVAPRMYAWKRRLLGIKEKLESLFDQEATLFYSRVFLLHVQLTTSSANHADPLQLLEENIENKIQFKSDVRDFTLKNEALMRHLASLPFELFDKIVRIGQRNHLIDYVQSGLFEALRSYCRHIPLLVNWVSNNDALEIWFKNSFPLDVALQHNALAHRSPHL